MNQDNKNNEGIDFSGALKDSGTGVKFEDTGWRAMRYYKETQIPKMIQWAIKYTGLSERQAGYTLLGLALIAIVVSLFLFFSGGGAGTQPLPYEETYKPFQ